MIRTTKVGVDRSALQIGKTMRRTAEHYHQEAERCRAQALNTPDGDVKAHLLDVARQYDKLSAHSKLK
jgi:hypothetical protein